MVPALSGCLDILGDDGPSHDETGDIEIEVGDYYFEPYELEIEVGETVKWVFTEPGHSVSCVPNHSDLVSLPADAEPFSSYEGDNLGTTVPEGETFSHTFEVTGEYTYVCIPHQSAQRGKITVQ